MQTAAMIKRTKLRHINWSKLFTGKSFCQKDERDSAERYTKGLLSLRIIHLCDFAPDNGNAVLYRKLCGSYADQSFAKSPLRCGIIHKNARYYSRHVTYIQLIAFVAIKISIKNCLSAKIRGLCTGNTGRAQSNNQSNISHTETILTANPFATVLSGVDSGCQRSGHSNFKGKFEQTWRVF